MTIAKVLAPNVDFMLCETLSCVKEAVAAVEAARSTGYQMIHSVANGTLNKHFIGICSSEVSLTITTMMGFFLARDYWSA